MKNTAIYAVKDAANHAGDASGNADRAVALMTGRHGDIDQVIEALEWAYEQSKKATHAAASALETVRLFKQQGGAL